MLTMSQDESAKPPQEPNKAIIAFLSVMFFGVLALNLPKSNAAFENPEITELNFIQENTLVGISNPYYTNLDKIELYGIEIPYLLYKIIECESNFDPDACNGENCEKGRGLIQLVSGTQKKYEEEIGRKIDPFDPIDNIECGLWLYKTHGTTPWGYPPDDPRGYTKDGLRWGSWSCWNKYLDN